MSVTLGQIAQSSPTLKASNSSDANLCDAFSVGMVVNFVPRVARSTNAYPRL